MKKTAVLLLIEEMPEDIDPKDLMHRIYLMQKVQVAEEAIVAGDTVSHQEAVRISDEWLK